MPELIVTEMSHSAYQISERSPPPTILECSAAKFRCQPCQTYCSNSNSLQVQIARKALEPPDDPREADDETRLLAKSTPLGTGVPQHWSSVRCACIEGVLSTAILASRHSDVWEAAALLLREHWRSVLGDLHAGLLQYAALPSTCALSAKYPQVPPLLDGPPPRLDATFT